jgi:P pilus assembly chaperone PapD
MLSRNYLKTAGIVALILISLTTAVWGNSGLSVSPGGINIQIQTPQVVQGTISVSNIGDSPLNVTMNTTRIMKNSTTTLYADDGIATWITVNPAQFTLAPGEQKTVNYSIKIPPNVNYYDAMGGILIVGTPPKSNNNQTGGITTQVKQAAAVLVIKFQGYFYL